MFQKMFSAHRQNMQVWHRKMTLKRQDLLALMKDDSTAWPDFQEKLKELSDIQAKREEASLGFFLQLRHHLKPEQQALCNNFMECRLLNDSVPGKGRGRDGVEQSEDIGPDYANLTSSKPLPFRLEEGALQV